MCSVSALSTHTVLLGNLGYGGLNRRVSRARGSTHQGVPAGPGVGSQTWWAPFFLVLLVCLCTLGTDVERSTSGTCGGSPRGTWWAGEALKLRAVWLPAPLRNEPAWPGKAWSRGKQVLRLQVHTSGRSPGHQHSASGCPAHPPLPPWPRTPTARGTRPPAGGPGLRGLASCDRRLKRMMFRETSL